MRRITVGLITLGLGVFGDLGRPAEAGSVSRCTVSADVNLMPGVGARSSAATNSDERGSRPVDCRGRPSGPWAWPTPDDLIPQPDVDVDLNF
jgi:hypothetical protein